MNWYSYKRGVFKRLCILMGFCMIFTMATVLFDNGLLNVNLNVYAASDVTLFTDSFDGTLSNWSVTTGTWAIETGELSQSEAAADRQILVNQSFVQERVRIQTGIKFIDATGSAEILFRKAAGLNHNSVRLDKANNKVTVWLNGASYSLNYTLSTGVWYTVKVELNGTNIKFYVNNVLQIERDDNPLSPTGDKIGLATSGGHAHFDNFSIEKINNWDRTWNTLLSTSKIEKKGRDRLNVGKYEYPYIGLGGTTMFVGPYGFTIPDAPYKDMTYNNIRHEPMLLYDYWWDGTTQIAPFSLQGGYGASIDPGGITGDNFSQSLDIATGILTTNLNLVADGNTFDTTRTQFINPDGVLVIKISDNGPNKQFKLKIGNTDATRFSLRYGPISNGLVANISYGSPTKYACIAVKCSGDQVLVDTVNGVITCTTGTNPAYFYIAPASSLNEAYPSTGADSRCTTAFSNGYTTNYNNTTAWWSTYYSKSNVDIPDLGTAKWYARSLYYNAVAIAGSRVPPGCYATNPAGFFGDVCPEFDIVFSHLAMLYSNHTDVSKKLTDWIEQVQPNVETLASNPYYGYPAGTAKYAWLMGYDGTPVQDPSLEKGWKNDYPGANIAWMELSQALWTNGDLTKPKDILKKQTYAQVFHQQYYSDIQGYAHNGVWSPIPGNPNYYLPGDFLQNIGAYWSIKKCQEYGVSTTTWDNMLNSIYIPWIYNPRFGANTMINAIWGAPASVGGPQLQPFYWLNMYDELDVRSKPNLQSVIESGNLDYNFNKGWASAVASKLHLSTYANDLLRQMLDTGSTLYDDNNFVECKADPEDYKKSLELGAHGAFVIGIDQMLLNGDSNTTLKVFPAIPSEWETLGASFTNLRTNGGILVTANYSPSQTAVTLQNTGTASVTRDVLIRVPAGIISATDQGGLAVQGIVEGNFAKVSVTLAGGASRMITIIPATGSALPGTFNCEFPQNNAFGIANSSPTFGWGSSNGAASYTLTISQNADLSSPVFNQNVGNTTMYKTNLNLQSGIKYYWKVRATNANGNTDDSGGTFYFTTAGRTESDFFSGNFLDTGKWAVTGSCSVVNDQLKIAIPANGNDDASKILLTPGVSDYSLTAKIDFKPATNYLQAGIIVWQDSTHYVKLSRVYNNGNKYEFGGTSLSGGTTVTDPVTGSTAYIKLIKSGNTYTAFYSSDATTWTQIGGNGNAVLSSHKIGICGSSWSSATGTALIDWLYVK